MSLLHGTAGWSAVLIIIQRVYFKHFSLKNPALLVRSGVHFFIPACTFIRSNIVEQVAEAVMIQKHTG